MTPEERESVINEAVERTLLLIPEVVGNLMQNHSMKVKANKRFFEKYPEFDGHREIVAATVEQVEGDNPGTDFDNLLKMAEPMIRQRIKGFGKLDTSSVSKPDLDFSQGEF